MLMPSLYLFFLMIAPQLWVPAIAGLPVDWLLLPVWFAALALSGRVGRLFEFDVGEKVLMFFLLWMFIGGFLNGFNDEVTEHLYVYLRILVVYKFVVASFGSPGAIRKILLVFVVLAVVLTFEAIDHKTSADLRGWAGQRLGWIDPSVLAEGGTGRARWVGIFDGPGVFCVVFTIGLGVALPYLNRGFSVLIKFWAVGAVALMSVGTYLTGSRGGLLAGLGIVGLYVALRRKLSVRTIIGAVAISVAGFVLAPDWMTSIRDENKSAQHRVEMWAEGLDMLKDNPVFGVGRGNFKQHSGRLIAHNSAIEIVAETGLPGLLAWVLMFYLAVKNSFRTWYAGDSDAEKATGLSLGLALVGYIISAMFVTLEYETYYFLLALSVALARTSTGGQALTLKEVGIVLGGIVVGLGVLQVFVVGYIG